MLSFLILNATCSPNESYSSLDIFRDSILSFKLFKIPYAATVIVSLFTHDFLLTLVPHLFGDKNLVVPSAAGLVIPLVIFPFFPEFSSLSAGADASLVYCTSSSLTVSLSVSSSEKIESSFESSVVEA